MEYLMIEMKSVDDHPKKKSFFEKVMSLVIPVANPDYEQHIGSVKYWILEFENKESIPVREIGMNVGKEVVMKMPFKKNTGYWTDNNITYKYFTENFVHEEITEPIFKSKWNLIK